MLGINLNSSIFLLTQYTNILMKVKIKLKFKNQQRKINIKECSY